MVQGTGHIGDDAGAPRMRPQGELAPAAREAVEASDEPRSSIRECLDDLQARQAHTGDLAHRLEERLASVLREEDRDDPKETTSGRPIVLCSLADQIECMSANEQAIYEALHSIYHRLDL